MSDAFTALGKKVTKFEKLDVFSVSRDLHEVELTTNEVTAICPITGQPDFYDVRIRFRPAGVAVESKTCKLYFEQFRTTGIFCEALAVKIAKDFHEVLQVPVSVEVTQKSRGGIVIRAVAVCSMNGVL
jgi:7-cyano-7-deazaguanine reductase